MSLPEWFEVDRWVPPPGSIESRRVTGLMSKLGVESYAELQSFANDNREVFYRTAFEDLDLGWPVEWDELLDESAGRPWTRWFVGGRTNLTWLAIRRWVERGHGDRIALQWVGEDGVRDQRTYAELDDEVSEVAAGLRAIGVADGDVVGLYLPSILEASIALFALARIGAVVAPAFSGYGADALRERLELVNARYLITANGYLRHGKRVDMISVARESADAAGVQTVVVVPRLESREELRPTEKPWQELRTFGHDRAIEFFEPEKPWIVAFTSGSTGRPKGVVHCHGRMPYRAAIDMAYCIDMSERSCLYWPSDMGWLITPLGITTSLILGGRHLVVEGAPTYPNPDQVWKLVEEYGVTHLGSSPTLMRLMAASGEEWVEPFGLRSLEVIISAGEPMTSAAWRWMHRHVGRGVVPMMNHTGGTEIGCALLTGSPVVPMRECRFAGPPPGIAAAVLNAQGEPVRDELGELAVLQPWPSMTYGFWNEPDRWTQSYSPQFEGIYVHGDRAIEFSDGSWESPGRSDDLIKIGGKRIGPTEYEEIALKVDGVVGAAAVGIPDDIKGEAVVLLFTASAAAATRASEVTRQIQDRIEATLGKPFRASRVALVSELPVTRNAKIHRRAVRAWLVGGDPGDLSNLDNPASEASIRALSYAGTERS